jgi:NADH:ubiquinone oxidoreductase subunit 6 (subunit J)
VLNFVTVAVFYLLLGAPFIAMSQITVYAGAIMVLFLFVIMLLGAEEFARSLKFCRGRNRWPLTLSGSSAVEAAYLLVTKSRARWGTSSRLPMPRSTRWRTCNNGNRAVQLFAPAFEVTPFCCWLPWSARSS